MTGSPFPNNVKGKDLYPRLASVLYTCAMASVVTLTQTNEKPYLSFTQSGEGEKKGGR